MTDLFYLYFVLSICASLFSSSLLLLLLSSLLLLLDFHHYIPPPKTLISPALGIQILNANFLAAVRLVSLSTFQVIPPTNEQRGELTHHFDSAQMSHLNGAQEHRSGISNLPTLVRPDRYLPFIKHCATNDLGSSENKEIERGGAMPSISS